MLQSSIPETLPLYVKLVDLRGKSSNHFDDLFSTLEEWEAIIKSLEEFPVDHHSADLPKLENG